MSRPEILSYAQNQEDIVLWRALNAIPEGRYIDVGANDPTDDSVTRLFYEAGWRGISCEPLPQLASAHREQRPRDIMIEAAITSRDVDTITFHEIPDTGLSSLDDEVAAAHLAAGFTPVDITVRARRLDQVLTEAGWEGLDIHFLTVDVEGAEKAVFESVDLRKWRPWVILAEATFPNSSIPMHESWEPMILEAGYQLVQDSGLSRFYVAEEKFEELNDELRYPPNVLDHFITLRQRRAETRENEAVALQTSLQEEIARLIEANIAHEVKAAHVTAALDETATELEATRREVVSLRAELTPETAVGLEASAIRWRRMALGQWAVSIDDTNDLESSIIRYNELGQTAHIYRIEAERLDRELHAIHGTLSWRITRPLRGLRRRISRGRKS